MQGYRAHEMERENNKDVTTKMLDGLVYPTISAEDREESHRSLVETFQPVFFLVDLREVSFSLIYESLLITDL